MAELQDMMMKEQLFKSDCFVFHLMHSGLMSTEDLQKAFECPAEGVRKVVIATNVAETRYNVRISWKLRGRFIIREIYFH